MARAMRCWRAKNPANADYTKAYLKEWRPKNRALISHYTNKRRAMKRGNGGSHTPTEWRDKCALLGNVCVYCGEAKPLVRDHKIPLVRGGTDDITNIVPACRSCNSKKSRMTAYEYLAVGKAA